MGRALSSICHPLRRATWRAWLRSPLPQSLQYEELLEVVTHAVPKLNIDWPAEERAALQKSKLDERFLQSKPPSQRRSLPFFPDLHSEISRSWARPFSARLFAPASDYKAVPRVEQTAICPPARHRLRRLLPYPPSCFALLQHWWARPNLRVVLQSRKPPAKRSRRHLRTAEGSPYRGRAGCTALHGVRLSSVPSGGQSAAPASVTGHSGLQRAHVQDFSARGRSGTGMLATPSGVSRTVSSAVSCRSAVTGLRASSSVNTRGQPRVAGPLSTLFNSVEATAKCVCTGPAYCRSRDPSEEGGHRGGPSSPHSKEEWGATSHYRSSLTQSLSNEVEQAVSQIRSERRVSILPQHRKGEAYQYRVPPFGLALSPRTFTKCVDAALVPLRLQGIRILNYIDDWLILAASESLAARHRDVVLAHMKTLGLRLNAKKSVLSPLQRITYLGEVWDSTTMQACLSPARIESILTAVKRVKEGRSLTVKQFQQLLGLMAAASNVIPFGLLYMRSLQWWPKTKRVSPRGNPLRMIKVTRRGLRALDMWRKPWFLNQGPVLGAHCRRISLATDASLTGWGGGHEWPLHPRSVEWSPSQLAHQLPRDAGRISSLKYFLPDLRDHHVLVRTDSTTVVYYINHQGGLRSSSYSWASECGSRRPVEAGAEARGMDASPRGSEADMGNLWASRSGSLCHEGECGISSSSPGAGCHGTDVAEASSVRLSPDRSAPGSSGESTPGRGQPTTSSPVLAGPSMVLGPDISPRRLSMGDSRPEGSPLTGGGHHPSPPPGAVEAVGVASEGAQLIASGLSTEVVKTILQSRTPSTRKLYVLKWKLFTSWCGERQQDPANCPVGTVLEFLQARFSTGLAHSTLKVYVAPILAYHAPLGGMPVGKDPLVVRFLRSVLRLRPPTRPHFPTWDLAVVLEALCRPPFEPIKEIPVRFLTIKTALLLALTSLKRAEDLQALSAAPSHLEFAPGMTKAFLYPRPGYVPKVPTHTPRPVVFQASVLLPFGSPTSRSKTVCAQYVAALWRKTDQLFVCYGPPKKGYPATKQTLSRWIVDAISTAYESSDLPSPLGVKAHSTRAMAASKALMTGVPIQVQLIASGLSTEVVETILQKLYALKWKLFTSWCGERQQDPANCPVGTVLEFLQARFSTGLAHSTLKVYVAPISAYHAPLGGMPVGKDPLVICNAAGWSTPLTFVSHSWLFCSPALAPPLGRDLEVWWRGHLVPIAFSDAARVPEGERPRRCVSIHPSAIPAERSLHPQKLTPAASHVLLYFLVDDVIRPLHMHSERGSAKGVPIAFSDAASRSLGEPWLHM
ncbi:hypothetical protein M9458_056541 [Cirrhinus mrigala]|uniref:ribonuclease H n=1 Tax=Cirrhinus mrigala TaxID=683832 RepID=A0ABD0MD10_CIRMR